MMKFDMCVIGAGPAGCAAAIEASRKGANVLVVDSADNGRDKVCGDGLTPRAMTALDALNVKLEDAHITTGLRLIAGSKTRLLDWPGEGQFADHGAVLPRKKLDAQLATVAEAAGATFRWGCEALPIVEADTACAIKVGKEVIKADLIVAACGAQGEVARILGATRNQREPYALAIRTYVQSTQSNAEHLEACLTLSDQSGSPLPGYGWVFPTGDGLVNVGVGALSVAKNFKKLNLNHLINTYIESIREPWELGAEYPKPRAWRLPMSVNRRHGAGWVAVGDAAGLINPMNGEGIDYALESGAQAARLFVDDPRTAPTQYDLWLQSTFDSFLQTGRRFSFLIGHPWILKAGLKVALGSNIASRVTLDVMGNLVDSGSKSASGRTLKVADRLLKVSGPVLRKLAPS